MHKSTEGSLKWVMGLVVLSLVLVPLLAACAAEAPAPPPTPPTFAIKFDSNKPGCGGVCHEVVSQAPYLQPNIEGKYTLAYEANHAWAGHGFDPLDKLLTLNDCLACHAVGTGDRVGMGNMSSLALRDIVHKVHLSSPHFEAAQLGQEVLEEAAAAEEPRGGDCFTCHVVSGPSTTGL